MSLQTDIAIVPHCSPDLPPLAWCAVMRRGTGVVQVLHGTQVESGEGFMAAGAWNGGLDRAGLQTAHILAGTALWTEDGAVVFAASSDTHGPLFSLRKADELYVSNSLFFLLRMTGNEPDPAEPFYALRIVRAFRDCWAGRRVWLPLRNGTKVGVHVLQKLGVTPGLKERVTSWPAGPKPADFAQYRQLLQSGVDAVLRNAAHPQRRHIYASAANISRGYDSVATATVAAAAGCKLAISFSDSRQPDPMIDCGAEIAAVLGLECAVADRWDYQDMPELQEEESVFSTFALQLPVQAMEDTLRGRIVVAGVFSGTDNPWGYSRKTLTPRQRLRQATPRASGISNLEQRLRIGSLSFLPMAICARHLATLEDISRSTEMAPWRIEGDYDRPIARRIIEEAGVPREAFGQHKRGGGHASLITGPGLTARGRARYLSFQERTWNGLSSVSRWRTRARLRLDRMLWQFFYRQPWMAKVMHYLPFDVTLMPGRREDVRWPFLFMLQWSHSVVSRRYPQGFPDSAQLKSNP